MKVEKGLLTNSIGALVLDNEKSAFITDGHDGIELGDGVGVTRADSPHLCQYGDRILRHFYISNESILSLCIKICSIYIYAELPLQSR